MPKGISKATGKPNRLTHGMNRTPTYRAWCSMHERCYNKSYRQYADYGGRGITVCARWASFECFLEDMGVVPSGLTLERIDNAKGYGPGNCKWATRSEQAQNKRNNRFVTVGEITKTVTAWARSIGISRRALEQRIARGGEARAVTTPKLPTGRPRKVTGATCGSLRRGLDRVGKASSARATPAPAGSPTC